MMATLKPCPFCGNSEIKIIQSRSVGAPSGHDGWIAEIHCKCGARMRYWALRKLWAEESIEIAWNRRV